MVSGAEPAWKLGQRSEVRGATAVRQEQQIPGHGVPGRREATCALRPQHESVKTARSHTRATLLSWGMEQLYDSMILVVSELVTNALRHGLLLGDDMNSEDSRDGEDGRDRAGAPLVPELDPEGEIQLRLLWKGSHVLCAVSDPSSEVPTRKEPDFIAETGRGLHVVESCSCKWGWAPLDQGGKVVWALFLSPV